MNGLEDAQRLFAPEVAYLNTATYGLPPRTAFDALRGCADEWRAGRTSFEGWDRSVGAARATFARIAGVPEGDVAVGPTVSYFAGLIAGSGIRPRVCRSRIMNSSESSSCGPATDSQPVRACHSSG